LKPGKYFGPNKHGFPQLKDPRFCDKNPVHTEGRDFNPKEGLRISFKIQECFLFSETFTNQEFVRNR